VIYIKC